MDDRHTVKLDPASWVDEHGDALYRFALIRVKDPHVAEDLVQETLVSALQGLERFRGGSAVRTWLVGILKHKVIDHFRKSSREIVTSDLTVEAEESPESALSRMDESPPGDWPDDPDKALQNKEFWRVFVDCLEGLPEAFRRAFSLRELDGLKTDEICKIMDITPTNLWVILHRARGRLRACLQAKWFRGADG